MINAFENTNDERTQRKFNNQAQVLEKTIELQLDFFLLWIENSPQSFLYDLNFLLVIDLMELYKDNMFEIFIKKFASI